MTMQPIVLRVSYYSVAIENDIHNHYYISINVNKSFVCLIITHTLQQDLDFLLQLY
jgi:hypothetical protein